MHAAKLAPPDHPGVHCSWHTLCMYMHCGYMLLVRKHCTYDVDGTSSLSALSRQVTGVAAV
jgi:hypothetical protein